MCLKALHDPDLSAKPASSHLHPHLCKLSSSSSHDHHYICNPDLSAARARASVSCSSWQAVLIVLSNCHFRSDYLMWASNVFWVRSESRHLSIRFIPSQLVPIQIVSIQLVPIQSTQPKTIQKGQIISTPAVKVTVSPTPKRKTAEMLGALHLK